MATPQRAREYPRQCAWCGALRSKDAWYPSGRVTLRRNASHGICPRCAEMLRALTLALPPPSAPAEARLPPS